MRCPNFVHTAVFGRRTPHVAQEQAVEGTARRGATLGNNRVDGVLRMRSHQAASVVHAPTVDILPQRTATGKKVDGTHQQLLVRAQQRSQRLPVQIATAEHLFVRQIAQETVKNKTIAFNYTHIRTHSGSTRSWSGCTSRRSG